MPSLPTGRIDRFIAPRERFTHVEAAGGVVLLLCTAIALAIANSPAGKAYHDLWATEVGVTVGPFQMIHSLEHWINDGLMAVFFFVVGLEVKREVVLGELRDPRRAALPIAAALGGMVAPAAVYLLLQGGGPAARGWGIPMATDIAFVVACMAILGPRVPPGVRVMLLSLAIADDIGAVLVIAIGYTAQINALPLALAFVGIGVVLIMQQLGVRSFLAYSIVGVLVWSGFFHSGVHATVAGVLLGLVTPATPHVESRLFQRLLHHAGDELTRESAGHEPRRAGHVRTLRRAARERVSPIEYLEHVLHPWVAFAILPVFALANAGVHVDTSKITDPVAVAVALGLIIGKPIGITGFSWLAVRAGIARLPSGAGWPTIVAASILGGIGFTMALFIAGLALDGDARDAAKVGILGASIVAAGAGMVLLRWTLPPRASAAHPS